MFAPTELNAGRDNPAGPAHFSPPGFRSKQDAIYALLDGNEELRNGVLGDVPGYKRALQLETEAILSRTINPATLDRRVRDYKKQWRE